MPEVGTHVVVESEKVGARARSGVIVGVEGALLRVHWDDGEETAFVPAAGCLRVVESESERKPA